MDGTDRSYYRLKYDKDIRKKQVYYRFSNTGAIYSKSKRLKMAGTQDKLKTKNRGANLEGQTIHQNYLLRRNLCNGHP